MYSDVKIRAKSPWRRWLCWYGSLGMIPLLCSLWLSLLPRLVFPTKYFTMCETTFLWYRAWGCAICRLLLINNWGAKCCVVGSCFIMLLSIFFGINSVSLYYNKWQQASVQQYWWLLRLVLAYECHTKLYREISIINILTSSIFPHSSLDLAKSLMALNSTSPK